MTITVERGRLGMVRVNGLADLPQVLEMLADLARSASGGEALERFTEATRARDGVSGEDHPEARAAEHELDVARDELEAVLAPQMFTTLSRLDAGQLGAGLYELLTPQRSAA